MYRTDGYRVKTNDAMYELVPYIMPLRYDAANSIKYDVELDLLQDYVKDCRKRGINMSHMSIVIAAYLRLVSQNPFLNRFCMNKKIYARNHFCVSFVTLKPGSSTDTVTKIYFNLDDDIFEVNRKVQEAIEKSQQPTEENSLDKLMATLVRIPFLTSFAVGALKMLDRHFTLPFSIVDASPFHTSLFITNLASIRTNTIFHHIYEFGTTGIFCSLGQPIKKAKFSGDKLVQQKVIELGIVTDERIANGHYYGRCFKELHRYLKNPQVLESKPETVVKDPDVKVAKPKFIVK